MKHSTLLSAGTPLLIAAAAVFAVGDLNPPAGSVTATGKRLTEIEPRIAINATNTPGDATALFVISQPGSYYLTGNLSGVSGKSGILISADDVTLDLGGFRLFGGPGSLRGITLAGFRAGLQIRNGTIVGWGGDGLGGVADSSTIQGIKSRANGGWGLNGSGSYGLRIEGCSALTNGLALASTGGIRGGNAGSLILDCTSSYNTGSGFSVENGSEVSGSTSAANSGSGFSAASNCTILNCNAYANAGDGIICNDDCLIRDNLASDNGYGAAFGSNIHVLGTDNRVESNNCNTGDRGIDIDLSGNVVLRNTCSGNTINWDITPGNAVAPILSATTNSSPILGATYAGSLGSTDPNANFSY